MILKDSRHKVGLQYVGGDDCSPVFSNAIGWQAIAIDLVLFFFLCVSVYHLSVASYTRHSSTQSISHRFIRVDKLTYTSIKQLNEPIDR